MIGALLIDKPPGPTSHDVVALVRQAVGTRAVGHTGTLDPFASGLLVVLVGRATRLARFVEGQRKQYLATARLGVATTTDDRTGAPLGVHREVPGLSEADVCGALESLAGVQRQRPPAFSAKHVAGERSYRLARRGEAVSLPEAEVQVDAIELVRWESPLVVFRTTVSAGTYVRALARDLGERLGTGAHLVELRREAIGSLRVEDALPLAAVKKGVVLRDPREVLPELPVVTLDEAGEMDIRHGRPIAVPAGLTAAEYVGLEANGVLLAVARVDGSRLQPAVVLAG